MSIHMFVFETRLHLHPDIRDLVAAGKSAECLGKATELLKQRCLVSW